MIFQFQRRRGGRWWRSRSRTTPFGPIAGICASPHPRHQQPESELWRPVCRLRLQHPAHRCGLPGLSPRIWPMIWGCRTSTTPSTPARGTGGDLVHHVLRPGRGHRRHRADRVLRLGQGVPAGLPSAATGCTAATCSPPIQPRGNVYMLIRPTTRGATTMWWCASTCRPSIPPTRPTPASTSTTAVAGNNLDNRMSLCWI